MGLGHAGRPPCLHRDGDGLEVQITCGWVLINDFEDGHETIM